MPKPVCPNMTTATPLGPPGAQTPQKQHAGLLKLDAQPSADRIRLPEGAARKISASMRRACIPDTYAASDPNREPGRILIPGDGAAGDPRAQNRPAARQWRLRDAGGLSRLSDLPALGSQAHLPSCNRQVHIDLGPHGQTRPG